MSNGASKPLLERIISGDAVIASQVGPKDPYQRDPFWVLLEHRWLWICPFLAFSLAMVAAFPFDLGVSKWFLEGNAPGFIHKLTSAAEPFGNGLGVTFICIAMFLLDKARRRDLVLVVTTSLGAGMVANLIKVCVVRVRPLSYSFDGPVLETFGPWLESNTFTSAYQSFPSGHTTTAVGLALGLGLVYPRARSLLFTLAVLVGLHRVCVGAHYLSDVFAGAALGYLVAIGCCRIHLWKWRMIGAVSPATEEATTSVPPAHLDRSVTNRLQVDGSVRGDLGESSESAAN